MPLEFETYTPPGAAAGATVIVLLHGRGSDRFDLLRLRPGLPQDAIIVTPEAPFPAAPWGYGPGSAWYRYLGEDIPEPTTFEQAQQLLEEFLDRVPEILGVEPGPIVLGGFSQGGTMSLAHALRSPGRVEHVLNFSGFLARHPRVVVSTETVAGTRIFWGHGTEDGNIPWSMAQQGREVLRAAGADLEVHDYPIGHWIDPRELAHARAWIDAALRSPRLPAAESE